MQQLMAQGSHMNKRRQNKLLESAGFNVRLHDENWKQLLQREQTAKRTGDSTQIQVIRNEMNTLASQRQAFLEKGLELEREQLMSNVQQQPAQKKKKKSKKKEPYVALGVKKPLPIEGEPEFIGPVRPRNVKKDNPKQEVDAEPMSEDSNDANQ